MAKNPFRRGGRMIDKLNEDYYHGSMAARRWETRERRRYRKRETENNQRRTLKRKQEVAMKKKYPCKYCFD